MPWFTTDNGEFVRGETASRPVVSFTGYGSTGPRYLGPAASISEALELALTAGLKPQRTVETAPGLTMSIGAAVLADVAMVRVEAPNTE